MKLEKALISSGGIPLEAEAAQIRTRDEAVERRTILEAVKQLDLPQLRVPDHILSISYDRELRRSIVQIVDKNTGEVLQQMPGRDVVERARFYRELEGA